MHELFDLVVGTSTGSLMASLLFVNRLPAQEVINNYIQLGRYVRYHLDAESHIIHNKDVLQTINSIRIFNHFFFF